MSPVSDDLDTLVVNFRLLELAGAADVIAGQQANPDDAESWREYAECARVYHGWLAAGHLNPRELRSAAVSSDPSLVRVMDELDRWAQQDGPRGAYLEFLAAFEAMCALDGERMLRHARRVVASLDPESQDPTLEPVRDFFSPDRAGASAVATTSSYEILQRLADALGPSLGLTQHALADVRRFSLRPLHAE